MSPQAFKKKFRKNHPLHTIGNLDKLSQPQDFLAVYVLLTVKAGTSVSTDSCEDFSGKITYQ